MIHRSFRRARRQTGKRQIFSFLFFAGILLVVLFASQAIADRYVPVRNADADEPIKWVDFDIPYQVLDKTMNLDIESYTAETHLDWIELLSYLGARYGGNFKLYKERDLKEAVTFLQNGGSIADLADGLSYFDYYLEAYTAILGGFLGEYKIQEPEPAQDSTIAENTSDPTETTYPWVAKYGLKVFSPIAAGYWYDDYDDFGSGRSYGYDRKHFGHDLIVSTGTPVIAIESGIVEAMGWNQYGGWRIGIRSFDKKRYYYYAHLRKDRPYSADLYVGKAVNAGDVIGYSGRTGYSRKENVNNIDQPHLHIGMQLIFDEAEKDSPNQIWIDLYAITRLLSRNKSPVTKDEETKEYTRTYNFSEVSPYEEEQQDNENPSELQLITTSAAPDGSVPVPVIMYHGLLKDPARQNKFYISPASFEEDLAYLKKHDYTTVFIADLINYVNGTGTLPAKPVVLTLDDGFYNNYTYAYPLLKQYGMKAIISIVGSYTDNFTKSGDSNAAYSYLTWGQVEELWNSGLIEPQNHSYYMHAINKNRQGSKQNKGESQEAYEAAMTQDAGSLQNQFELMTGYRPNTFVYPFGLYAEGSTVILKKLGFQASMTCREGTNYIAKDPDDLFLLKRYLRPSFISSELFFLRIGMD